MKYWRKDTEILDRIAREGIIEKVTLEYRLKGNKNAPWVICGKRIPGKEKQSLNRPCGRSLVVCSKSRKSYTTAYLGEDNRIREVIGSQSILSSRRLYTPFYACFSGIIINNVVFILRTVPWLISQYAYSKEFEFYPHRVYHWMVWTDGYDLSYASPKERW